MRRASEVKEEKELLFFIGLCLLLLMRLIIANSLAPRPTVCSLNHIKLHFHSKAAMRDALMRVSQTETKNHNFCADVQQKEEKKTVKNRENFGNGNKVELI